MSSPTERPSLPAFRALNEAPPADFVEVFVSAPRPMPAAIRLSRWLAIAGLLLTGLAFFFVYARTTPTVVHPNLGALEGR